MTVLSAAQNQFFSGIRTPDGFFSCANQSPEYQDLRFVYIIKGFPGWGKSALLNAIVNEAAKLNAQAEVYPCPAYPSVPDGVYLSEFSTLILAGTPPHLPEPGFSPEKTHYLCLPGLMDEPYLQSPPEEVASLWKGFESTAKRTDFFLSAAGYVDNVLFDHVLAACPMDKIEKRANGIIKREIPIRKTVPLGTVSHRFLNALTKNGFICLFETAEALCTRIYMVTDNYGLAPFLLAPIKEAAIKNGYHVICCNSVLHPENALAHLIIPELSLAFLTSSRHGFYTKTPYRHIRLDAIPDAKKLHSERGTMRLWQKTQDSLLSEAVSAFSENAETYRKLSAAYSPFSDPDALGSLIDAVLSRVFFKKKS